MWRAPREPLHRQIPTDPAASSSHRRRCEAWRPAPACRSSRAPADPSCSSPAMRSRSGGPGAALHRLEPLPLLDLEGSMEGDEVGEPETGRMAAAASRASMSSYSAGLTSHDGRRHLPPRRPDHQAPPAQRRKWRCEETARAPHCRPREERGGGHYGRGHEQEPARRAEARLSCSVPPASEKSAGASSSEPPATQGARRAGASRRAPDESSQQRVGEVEKQREGERHHADLQVLQQQMTGDVA